MLTIAQANFTINAEIADRNDLFEGKVEEHQGIGRAALSTVQSSMRLPDLLF